MQIMLITQSSHTADNSAKIKLKRVLEFLEETGDVVYILIIYPQGWHENNCLF